MHKKLEEELSRYGFDNILKARELLKGYLIAPCPHQKACPMALAGDWCHFSERVSRSALHRKSKGAELGYEDEKYSYLIASRIEAARYEARILRHPQIHSGHVEMTLCTAEGCLQRKTYSKKLGELYKQMRKKEWGDIIAI